MIHEEGCELLTIFLVDDETIELDLMENHIDWASMGIQVVGTARNGRKAWERFSACSRILC